MSVAEELALASTLLAGTPDQAVAADACAQQSVDTLRAAVAAGLQLPDDLGRRESFAALRSRPDFAKLTTP